jgi:sn-glycerol 3-phosphate transport system substrate-binding protein
MTIKQLAMRSGIAVLLAASVNFAASAADLEFYFPVQVSGKAGETIKAMTEEWAKAHPEHSVKAIYAGSYGDATKKAMAATRAGKGPQLSVLLGVDIFTFLEEDLIEPFDNLISSEEDKAWLKSFYPAFMIGAVIDGKTYGIPFQRSTPVLYYNKDAFKAAGLDPNQPPETWTDIVEMGKKLTLRDSDGNVKQWGTRIALGVGAFWLFGGLVIENGAELASPDGKTTYFDDPRVVEALQYVVDLSTKHKVMRPGVIDWGTTPKAFLEGQTAMMWTSTGNLANVRANAEFEFGVAMLPKGVQRGAPTGGGNFFVFKDSTDEQKKASVEFIKWMTAPAQAARWSMVTGYVAPRPDAWETEVMKKYTAEFPQALVARDQLKYAKAELSTYQRKRVADILNDAIFAAVNGEKTAEESLKDAQAKAEAILKDYR